MISVPEIVLERISVSTGREDDLVGLAHRAVDGLAVFPDEVGGVLAATFSLADRFPSLAVRAASWLGLPASTPAFDLQMACSAYPYAVYLAGRLAADTGKKVIVIFRGDGSRDIGRLADACFHDVGSAGGHRTLGRAEFPLSAVTPGMKPADFVQHRLMSRKLRPLPVQQPPAPADTEGDERDHDSNTHGDN